MILVADVYNLLIDSLRADKRGNSCEPDEFNRKIELINQEIFDEYIKAFEANTVNSDSLAFLKVHDAPVNLAVDATSRVAQGTMPDYYQIIGKPWILDGTTPRRVDEVTEFEDGVREDDYLTKATITSPTCRIGGVDGNGDVRIKVRPQTVTTVYVSYLREVAVPFMDYYIDDTQFTITPLPMTAVAQSIPSGCTYRDGTAGGVGVTKTSLTQDFEWGQGDLSLIINKLIQRIGAVLPDEGLVKTAMAEEIKSKE